MVKIYIAHNSKRFASSVWFNRYLNNIPIHMKNKIESFRRLEDSSACLLGKLLLKQALVDFSDKYGLSDVKYSSYGRPYISDSFDFNISHSGDYVVCVFAENAKIGVDVEKIKEINYLEFKEVFSQQELAEIENSKDILTSFYKYWSIKEAVSKVDGRGIAVLSKVKINADQAFLEGKKFKFKNVTFDQDYTLIVASNEEISEKLLYKSFELTC